MAAITVKKLAHQAHPTSILVLVAIDTISTLTQPRPHPDLEFSEGNGLHPELAESADSASGFQKGAEQEAADLTGHIGSAEEGRELRARNPIDATLLVWRESQPTRWRAGAIRCLDWW